MGNGVVIIPTREFQKPSRWYYRLWKVAQYVTAVVTYGMVSIQNFVKILKDII